MGLKFDEIKQYTNLGLVAKQLVEGFITGIHRSPYHGFSVEFAEHKLYNFGESTKHIDWKVFARTDRLYTRNYEEETNLRCRILLDCSSSMYYPKPDNDKIKFSVFGAAALAYLLTKQRDVVGLSLFSDEFIDETSFGSTQTHLAKLLDRLEEQLEVSESQQPTDLVKILHEAAEKTHKRSLIILFSDMFQHDEERLLHALQHLRYKKHEVILFHVSDYETELSLEFDNRPHKFVDAETGASITLNPSQVRDAYQEVSEKFYHQLKLKCGSMGVDFIPVNTKESFDKILSGYLIKRKKMA